ncbi:MAG: hypothetical protein K9I99_10060 [Melioribacteraceae bacterium]|nr:hypothetical protein [Melioribacteraceae bacterium]MCF8431751.1 hypothetical protein [Melioribacteraceae bacterium]
MNVGPDGLVCPAEEANLKLHAGNYSGCFQLAWWSNSAIISNTILGGQATELDSKQHYY